MFIFSILLRINNFLFHYVFFIKYFLVSVFCTSFCFSYIWLNCLFFVHFLWSLRNWIVGFLCKNNNISKYTYCLLSASGNLKAFRPCCTVVKYCHFAMQLIRGEVFLSRRCVIKLTKEAKKFNFSCACVVVGAEKQQRRLGSTCCGLSVSRVPRCLRTESARRTSQSAGKFYQVLA